MRVLYLSASNYRALESFEVEFDRTYTALTGANNSGKSSLINALRLLIGQEDHDYGEELRGSLKSDYTNWRGSPDEESRIVIAGTFECDPVGDASLVAFLAQILRVEDEEVLNFTIEVSYTSKRLEEVTLKIGDKTWEGQAAAEVRKRIRDGSAFIYHNSPTDAVRTRYYGGLGQLSQLSRAAQAVLDTSRSEITRKLKKATAAHQAKLQELVSKLSDKLTVEVELPVQFGYIPFNLALNQGGGSVPLGGWGSGTQNKTLIMLALIRAAQVEELESATDKITPIILIEEPESFLHPSAQSEFGTTLIRVADKLGVQVIVATHSVSFLNTDRPSANVLLNRDTFRGKPRGTKRVAIHDGNWMQPFAELLGYTEESFKPWHDAITMRGQKVLLVEGAIDKRYLERMKDAAFGNSALRDDIQIFSYNGADNLRNESILKLVINLSRQCVVTCDFDAIEKVKKTIDLLGLEEGRDFLYFGKGEADGCIEDYVPKAIKDKVFSENPQIVSRLMSNSSSAKSAKSEMKQKICDALIESPQPEKDFSDFLGMTKRINKLFS